MMLNNYRSDDHDGCDDNHDHNGDDGEHHTTFLPNTWYKKRDHNNNGDDIHP